MRGLSSLFHKPHSKPRKPSAYSPLGGLSPEFIEKHSLTKREAGLTEILLRGKSNKDIGALLEITLNTVQVHLKHIYRKTGVRGRYELMALVSMRVKNEE
jgi:DNA-binding CsgD family transcriptional regulator